MKNRPCLKSGLVCISDACAPGLSYTQACADMPVMQPRGLCDRDRSTGLFLGKAAALLPGKQKSQRRKEAMVLPHSRQVGRAEQQGKRK